MLKNKYHRIRLIDVTSSKRYEIEAKDKWYSPWDMVHSVTYKYQGKPISRQEAITFIEEIMEDSVILYDSKKG